MENLEKALRVLSLPDSFGKYNGLICNKVSYQLTEVVVTDYTKLIGIKPTVTTTYVERAIADPGYKMYALNHFNMLMAKNSDFSIIDEFTIVKPLEFFTINAGPFTGNSYWSGEAEVKMSKSGTNTLVTHTYNPFMNTTVKGFPEATNGINPSKSIVREDWTKTKTFTSSKPVKSYPVYTKAELMTKTGWSYEQIKRAYRIEYEIKSLDSNVNITSTGCKIVNTNNKYTGEVYINGILSPEIDYRKLTTSYGQKHPGYVFRWRLYNGTVNESIYGSSQVIKFTDHESTTIEILPSTMVTWDAVNRILTYDQTKPAQLWATFEELPAQGKNWGGEDIIDLIP